MPPLGAWPLSFLVVPVFGAALLLGGDRLRTAFGLSWVAGTVAFLGILTWAVNITPGGVLAWPLLSAVEGIYLGAFGVVVAPLLRRAWIGGLALAIGWVGIEVLRGSWPEGGFGWATLAYAHVDGSWLASVARFGGEHLITLLVALMGGALFESWKQARAAVGDLPGSSWQRFQAGLPHGQPPLFVLAGLLFVSVLATIEPPATDGTLDVLVVQGNDFETTDLCCEELDLAIAGQHLDLTLEAVDPDDPPDVIVWPESAIDRDPFAAGNEMFLKILQTGAQRTRAHLVAGVRQEGPTENQFRNTALVVTPDGEIAATYDKRELVPFGEYVPARRLLGGLGPLNAVPEDGVRGTEPTHLPIVTGDRTVDLAIAICFETLFGDTVRDNVRGLPGREDAGIIVATTNDASFGRGSEPAQHLDQSRLRALETGRWVVHAAISGSSAFVSPDGEVLQATDLFTATIIRMDVPIAAEGTPFLAVGDVAGRLGLLALAGIAILRAVGAVRARRPIVNQAA